MKNATLTLAFSALIFFHTTPPPVYEFIVIQFILRCNNFEKLTHARKLNMARRHLTQEQKRGLIREQLKDTPEQSDRQIAQALGVSHPTVAAQRKEMESNGELEKFTSCVGADGKERPRKPVSVFNPTKREERAMKKPEVSVISCTVKSGGAVV